MRGKIKNSIINIVLICENNNYCEQNLFIKIDNYYKPKAVLDKDIKVSYKINFIYNNMYVILKADCILYINIRSRLFKIF